MTSGENGFEVPGVLKQGWYATSDDKKVSLLIVSPISESLTCLALDNTVSDIRETVSKQQPYKIAEQLLGICRDISQGDDYPNLPPGGEYNLALICDVALSSLYVHLLIHMCSTNHMYTVHTGLQYYFHAYSLVRNANLPTSSRATHTGRLAPWEFVASGPDLSSSVTCVAEA